MAAQQPKNPLSSDTKLTRSTEKLVQSLNSLEKSASAVGTALGAAALTGLLKNLSVAIPKAATQLVGELNRSVQVLNRSIVEGTRLLKTAFQSLYLILRSLGTSFNSLFQTVNLGLARSTRSGGGGRPRFITTEVGLKSVAASTNAHGETQVVVAIRQVNASLRQGLNGIETRVNSLAPAVVTPLQQIGAMILNTNTLLSQSSQNLTSLLNTIVSRDLNLVANLIVNLGDRNQNQLEHTRDAIVDVIRNVGRDTTEGLEAIARRGGDMMPLQHQLVFGLDLAIQTIINQTRILSAQVDEQDRHLQQLIALENSQVEWLARIGSPNSLHVHVKDDPASRSGGAKAGGGGPLGKLQGVVAPFARQMSILGAVMTATAAALNPGTVEQLWLGFRDILATIGTAFEPAITVVSTALRQIAGAILPLFLRLRPILTQVVQAYTRYLVAGIQVVASLFMAFVPILNPLAAVLDGVATIFQYLSSVLTTFIDLVAEGIAGLMGTDFKDAMKGIVSSLEWVGQQLVLTIATIAKKLGHDGFVDKLIKHFEEAAHPRAGGALAAGQTSLGGLDEILKQMATSAARAGGIGGASPEEEAKQREEERLRMAQETLDALREIAKKGETDKLLQDLLDAAIGTAKVIQVGVDFVKAINQFFVNIAGENARGVKLESQLQNNRRKHGLAEPTEKGSATRLGSGNVWTELLRGMTG